MSLQKKLIPNLSIGIFADIQYADVEDGWNFPKTKKRCYRKAKDCLFELMETFNFYSSSNLEKFSKPINPFPEKTKTVQVLNEKFKSDFEKTIISNSRPIQTIFQLGDLIDNKCSVKGKEENNFPGEGKKSIEMLLKIIEADKETENRQFFHCSGNHEFYNITREDLANKYYYQKKNLFSDTLAFIEPLKEDPSIKIIHLDSYDISYSGRLTNDFKKPENPTDQNYEKFKKAEKLLLENNKNFAASNGKSGENSPQGVPEGDPRARFVAYTGGLSEEQTEWFKNLVINLNADSDTSKIILLSHCQLLPEASDGKIKSNPIWNYPEILEIIDTYDINNKIWAYFAGHAHMAGYFHDTRVGKTGRIRNLHHITMGGIIEKTETNHFGILEFYDEFAVLKGFGDCETRVLNY